MCLFFLYNILGGMCMIEESLYSVRCEEDALYMSRYMRDQFKFLGVKSPKRKEIQNNYFKNIGSFDIEFARRLYRGEYREFKYVSIDYIIKNKKHLKKDDILFIKDMIVFEPWWDTVDLIASNVVGYMCTKCPELINGLLKDWVNDSNMWVNRTSIIFQLRYKDRTDTDFLKYAIESNMGNNDFFIQKAIGWALREYSKSNGVWVKDFVHSHDLSKLAFREGMKFLNRR